MNLCKMIEIYLKYDNMHTIRTINAFICINNHVNSCINSMLSVAHVKFIDFGGYRHTYNNFYEKFIY